MRVKCLAQEHNTMSPARARTRSARSGVERANHEATAPPEISSDCGKNLFETSETRDANLGFMWMTSQLLYTNGLMHDSSANQIACSRLS